MRTKDNILFDIFDSNTSQWTVFEKTTVGYDGTTITSSNEYIYIDGAIWIKVNSSLGGGYAKRILDDGKADVRWFGVVGDDVTNDRLLLMRAFDFSGASGVPLKIIEGTNISIGGGSITIPSNVKIYFDGGTIEDGTLIGDGTFISAPDIKIFSTDVTLQGTFKMPYICPQHYGGIANSVKTVYENECSAEINACIQSPISTYLPSGFYYATSSLVFDKPTNFTMSGVGTQTDNDNNDHAVIYTDADIDLVLIQSSMVNIMGTFDVTGADFTSDAIKYDLNYDIFGGTLDVNLIGSRDRTMVLGKGGNGIRFDQSSITTNGFAVFIKLRGNIEYFHTGIKSDTKVSTIYVNSIDCDINIKGCKKHLEIDKPSISDSKFVGSYQVDSDVIASGEEDYYVVYIGGNKIYINALVFDPDGQPVFNLAGDQISIGPDVSFYFDNGLVEGRSNLKTDPIQNPLKSIISRGRTNYKEGCIISKLDSETVALDKRFTVTINAYKGATVDFDTDLNETSSGLLTTDITLSNTSNLFNFSEATGIVFTNLADLDNDFVEIVLSGGGFEWSAFYIYITQSETNRFKRIQFIEHYVGSTEQYNIYPNLSQAGRRTYIFDDELPSDASTKTIIRFIGNEITDSSSGIADLCGVRRISQTLPYVHINGGQRVYGTFQAAGLYNTGSDYTEPFRMGAYRLWVDDSGLLRIKNGAPSSQSDGNLV